MSVTRSRPLRCCTLGRCWGHIIIRPELCDAQTRRCGTQRWCRCRWLYRTCWHASGAATTGSPRRWSTMRALSRPTLCSSTARAPRSPCLLRVGLRPSPPLLFSDLYVHAPPVCVWCNVGECFRCRISPVLRTVLYHALWLSPHCVLRRCVFQVSSVNAWM